jgi:acetyl esterase/lipase
LSGFALRSKALPASFRGAESDISSCHPSSPSPMRSLCRILFAFCLYSQFDANFNANAAAANADDELPQTQAAETTSPLDGATQPLLWWAPPSATTTETPLFVFLHSWSSDYLQDNSKWLRECVRHNWIWLHPNFRGANQSPKACGSKYARQDILDAMDWALQKWKIDRSRIYLAGVSGGGHMSLLMAGWHPDRFSAVSAWVGPTDLAEWHRFHSQNGKPQKYAKMIEKSLLGPPGASPMIDADYRDRSPVFHLPRVGDLPVTIWAGVEDGHSGSVPVSHSLRAFNAIASAHGNPVISDDEIRELTTNKKLAMPLPSDQTSDPNLPREILLRRTSKNSLVTIFEGGHESLPEAAFAWLKRYTRKTAK